MPKRKPVSSLSAKVVSPKVSWKIFRTRFSELGYQQVDTDLWRFVDFDTKGNVGGGYPSKTELLADLPRFAYQFGCKGAEPPLSPLAKKVRCSVIRECITALRHKRDTHPVSLDEKTLTLVFDLLHELAEK